MPFIIALLIALTVGFGGVPFFVTSNVLQSALFSVSSASLSVLIGIFVINIFLNSKERRHAAVPLLRLLGELVAKQHNDYFIIKGRDTFGMEKFNYLMNSYSSNARNPQVFAPDELDALVLMIESMKKELLEIYLPLEASCRDIGYILGWAYDPKILSAILNTRAHILKFVALAQHETPSDINQKRSLVAQYLNIEGSVTFWVDRLEKKAGLDSYHD